MLGATLSGFKVRAYRSARGYTSLIKRSVKEIRHVPGGNVPYLLFSQLSPTRRVEEVIEWGSPHA